MGRKWICPAIMLLALAGFSLGRAETVTISWVAPGDDGSIGTASEFDLRYSNQTIDNSTWDDAVQVNDLPLPRSAGTVQSVILEGLDSELGYFFAMKAVDDAGNWSTLSNVVYLAYCENDCQGIRGNANSDPDDRVNISDVQYLINYLFGIPSGPQPVCAGEANANGDLLEKTNVSDVNYLLAYLFGQPSGPPPPPCP